MEKSLPAAVKVKRKKYEHFYSESTTRFKKGKDIRIENKFSKEKFNKN